ncbi:hypothetical protein [Shewanella frigidimarina]|uniref:hypothetical protein n=1 Tax=Shewanella frigidimarina TaxID=56812 RepID=UPI003D79DA46
MNTQLFLELALLAGLLVLSALVIKRFGKNNNTTAQKLQLFLTGLLGGFLIMAGTVKFFDPFTTMFTTQISLSELPFPTLSRWAGQLGEITAGLIFLFALILRKSLNNQLTHYALYGASSLTTIIMFVAVYVHLLPGVPAEVLPLQSKPPVLTVIIILLVWLNAYLFHKNKRLF